MVVVIVVVVNVCLFVLLLLLLSSDSLFSFLKSGTRHENVSSAMLLSGTLQVPIRSCGCILYLED